MKSLAETREWTQDVIAEVKKVTWPDWPQLRNSTWIIIVFVIIVALIIWVMDLGVRGVVNLILDAFAH